MAEPQELLTDYEAKLEAVQRKAEQVRDGLNRLAVTERSDDGLITVTVNATGNLTDLRLGNLHDSDGPELARSIMRTVQAAQSKLVDAVQTTMPPTIGNEMMGELVRQYRDSYPELAPEPARGGRRTLRLGANDETTGEMSPPPRERRTARPPSDYEDTDFSNKNFLR